jgi:predicted nucleic acid-binding protein
VIIVDSDIIIWILRGELQIVEQFKKTVVESNGNVFITPVQIAEVHAGMMPKEKEEVDHFFAILQVVPLTAETGVLAGSFMNKYRKSHGVALADALIAAATRLSGNVLWTQNVKHYPMLRKDEIFRV